MTPVENAEVNGSTLTAKKDGNVTLQAKVGNTLSNTLKLNITWVINGHTLPPEPDKTLNDSTLLGIDVNDNGVRDDVERIIYKTYQNKHPIHIDIGMQAARGYKLVLETPERAKEIHDEVNSAGDCEAYYKIYAKYLNEPILIKDEVTTRYFRKNIYFNTEERMIVYMQYDTLLSGGTYSLPEIENMKALCDFDVNQYKE
jgi:hypothetical protein